MNHYIQKKIEDYETFVQDTLKKDLTDIEVVLNTKTKQFNDWEDVKKVVDTVEEFKAKDRDMAIQVDMNCGVRAFGEITDFERTYIDIGLGIMLEMDCKEAKKYADIRLRLLKHEIDHFRKMAVNVKVHIKMTLLALSELQESLLPMYKKPKK